MRLASHCRGRPARVLRALVLAVAALLAACHTSTNAPPGTPVVSWGGEGTSPDFVAYTMVVDSITLTRSDQNIISLISVPETVDMTRVGDLAELVEAPAVPNGTYISGTMALDFSSASIWTFQNGKPVAASLTDVSGAAAPTFTVPFTFDPNHPLVITNGASQRLHIYFDLAASNTITAGTTPSVVVQPFVVISPASVDSTVMRARGLFVTVPTGSNYYIQNARPFFDQQSALGAVNVNIGAQTYFNINGLVYTGSAGLAAMGSLQINTPTAAIGTLDNLSGITPSMNATEVYAGESLESPVAFTATGVVSARSGNTLTLSGVTLYVPNSSISLGYFAHFASTPVTVASSTLVTEDGVTTAGLTAASISVGQQVSILGNANYDQTTNILTSMDATGGLVRLNSTQLWGTLNSATAGSAFLDVLTLGNFPPVGLTFAGTGATPSDPAAYNVSTGSLDQSGVAAGTLLQVAGTVTPFGAAPPDFQARAITPGTSTTQQLVVEWVNGGSAAPFSHAGSDYLQVNLADANLGSVHYIRTGPAALDLKTLPQSPQITTTGAPQSNLMLAVGSISLTSGISVFNSATGFATALGSTFNGTNKIYRLVAYGQYNAATNSFVAQRIFVALQETAG